MNGTYELNSSHRLEKTARYVVRNRRWVKVLTTLMGLIIVTLAMIYVSTSIYRKYGSFTVSVSRLDALDYALSLSETRDFYSPTSRLNADAAEEITNISVNDLPDNLDSEQGGQKHKSGDNYMAYTYFVKNSGKKPLNAEYMINISNMTLDIEKAVRIRLYVNGVPTDYASPALDGNPEPNTVEFLSDENVTVGYLSDMQPDDVTRFTVVMWLEGDDPECVDNILGGQFKLDMKVRFIGGTDEEAEA